MLLTITNHRAGGLSGIKIWKHHYIKSISKMDEYIKYSVRIENKTKTCCIFSLKDKKTSKETDKWL